MQNRFKSTTLWLAVASLIAFVLKTYFNIVIADFDTLINMILNVLILFGILNNPTNKERF